MIVLLVFAVLAGAGTALSPCVLPVLPALLSASGVGGRRRPLGIVIGLSVTLTVTIVGLANVVGGIGLGNDPLRDLSIAVLLVFGVSLLAPALSARIEAPLSRLARFGPRSGGDGFLSGLVVGAALGFVYTPCASPILAAVISVSAATGRTITLALAYAAGSARGAARARVRRQEAVRPDSPGGAGTHAAAGAGRRDDRHRRSPSPPAWTSTSTSSWPSTSPTSTSPPGSSAPPPSPTACPRSPATGPASWRPTGPRRAAGAARRRNSSRPGRPPASRRCWPTRARCRTRARRPNSPTPRSGSTPPAGSRCRSPRCGAGSCSWTSGPTPASTASARSPT